jgi:signal transduction histidine kinase
LGQMDQAFCYFDRSLELASQTDDKFTRVFALLSAARFCYKLADYETARLHLYRGLALAEESKQKGFQFECHELFANIYKTEGEFEKALVHFEKFHQLNREVFNEQSDRRLKNLLIRHRTEVAQKEILIYQSKNIDLEHQILERHKVETALHKTNAQLTELNASKDKFFSIMAHDLRGPFTPLLSLAELLAESTDELELDQIKEASQAIFSSAKKVHDLLETLLEWSRLQLGRLDYHPVAIKLYTIVEKNLQLFAPGAQEKKITLQNEVPPEVIVWADRYMLDTVVRNLISNALKFTNNGGSIQIQAEGDCATDQPTPNELVEVRVIDTGVGISPEGLNKLFKVEENYHTRGTAQEKGTGLGLIICKEMVERNKGQIWVKSQLGQGTTFKFTVPCGRF